MQGTFGADEGDFRIHAPLPARQLHTAAHRNCISFRSIREQLQRRPRIVAEIGKSHIT
jgi:hypothetical protein